MTHRHYHQLEAPSYFEMGLRKAELFSDALHEELEERKSHDDWGYALVRARRYLEPARQVFPQLIQELEGYAQGARIPLDEMWLLSLEDELDESNYDRCTTIVTNGGTLIGHNEDWSAEARESVCLLRRSIDGRATLELFYYSTLGGNAISINSNGFVHAVNSLSHNDHRVGVSRNVVARWLSETQNPERDFRDLSRLTRAAGYHHTVASLDGTLWSVECSARDQRVQRPAVPFVHTNHYLTDVAPYEDEGDYQGTYTRYRSASQLVRPQMTVSEMQQLLRNSSDGAYSSIFNERTIASVVLDLAEQQAHVWLARETQSQWITYSLETLFVS
jgi:isopenicillin-N N-acyltransferase-like protein